MNHKWYAIEYAYGRNRTDRIHRFDTLGAMVAFIAARNCEGVDADALAATHKLVKRALRYAKQGESWPVAVLD